MERMCHVCRRMRPRAELLRVVRYADGRVAVDPTGKAQGRGCYVCTDGDCIARGVKVRYLNRAFHGPVSDEVYREVLAYAGHR